MIVESQPDSELLVATTSGLYCPGGDFYIDPWQPVPRAIVTHAHADHARRGSRLYLGSRAGGALLRLRLGPDASLELLEYGERRRMGDVSISLHPAGHILGSAQLRIEGGGRVCVVTGDFKLQTDATCQAFEPPTCDHLVIESTFGLPVFRWPTASETAHEINQWWQTNQQAGRASLLFGYSLGKAQRLLSLVDAEQGPIFTHGAVQRGCDAYRESGVILPPTTRATEAPAGTDWSQALIIAPPSAQGTPWIRRFGVSATGWASGWMRIRGIRRRRALDRGFVLSDHADWPALLETVRLAGAATIWVTHGYASTLAAYLRESGLRADAVRTSFLGETPDGDGAGEEMP